MLRKLVPDFKSIQVKVVGLFMVIALFTVTTTAITIINYEKSNSKTQEAHRLESISQILVPALTAAVVFQDEVTASELLLPLMSDNTIIDAVVTLSNDSVFVTARSPHIESVDRGREYISVTRSLNHDGTSYGELTIRANDLSIRQHISVYTLFIGLIASVTLITSFILALFFSRYIIKPIISLGRVAERVTMTGNYALRVKNTSSDEIGNLTECFNVMLENIEQRDSNLETKVKQRTEALEIANDLLKKQAFRDSLSDLPNRRYLNEELRSLVSSFNEGTKGGFSLLFLDLDGFKEVNDTLGHDYGDILLIAVSQRLRNAVPETDLIARLGGDEFTVLMSDVTDRSLVSSVAENIHTELKDPFYINGEEVYVTVSIGIAQFPENGKDSESILKCADLAMYEAKAAGRNCYRYFDDSMMERLIAKREKVVDLKIALSEDQFELFFQPIVDLESGEVRKVEALIRWNHPEKGQIFPNDFISVAEEFGIINDIGEWVLTSAASHAPLLKEAFGREIQVSVNVSPAQFKGDFTWIDSWLEKTRTAGTQPHLVSIEITENLLMTSDAIVRRRLRLLKEAGVEIAIDDFGVGYSSLSYLQQIEVDVLKIDRSFVRNLVSDSNSQALCKAMINMAEELDIRIVAEGVEEADQALLLTRFGCHYGQGYFFGRPMPLESLINQYSPDKAV